MSTRSAETFVLSTCRLKCRVQHLQSNCGEAALLWYVLLCGSNRRRLSVLSQVVSLMAGNSFDVIHAFSQLTLSLKRAQSLAGMDIVAMQVIEPPIKGMSVPELPNQRNATQTEEEESKRSSPLIPIAAGCGGGILVLSIFAVLCYKNKKHCCKPNTHQADVGVLFEWSWRKDDGSWQPYEATVQRQLNAAVRRGDTFFNIDIQIKRYQVDWSDISQVRQV